MPKRSNQALLELAAKCDAAMRHFLELEEQLGTAYTASRQDGEWTGRRLSDLRAFAAAAGLPLGWEDDDESSFAAHTATVRALGEVRAQVEERHRLPALRTALDKARRAAGRCLARLSHREPMTIGELAEKATLLVRASADQNLRIYEDWEGQWFAAVALDAQRLAKKSARGSR